MNAPPARQALLRQTIPNHALSGTNLMMTLTNYETAIKIIRDVYMHRARETYSSSKDVEDVQLRAKDICAAFSLFFQNDNPDFDTKRFYEVCVAGGCPCPSNCCMNTKAVASEYRDYWLECQSCGDECGHNE